MVHLFYYLDVSFMSYLNFKIIKIINVIILTDTTPRFDPHHDKTFAFFILLQRTVEICVSIRKRRKADNKAVLKYRKTTISPIPISNVRFKRRKSISSDNG